MDPQDSQSPAQANTPQFELPAQPRSNTGYAPQQQASSAPITAPQSAQTGNNNQEPSSHFFSQGYENPFMRPAAPTYGQVSPQNVQAANPVNPYGQAPPQPQAYTPNPQYSNPAYEPQYGAGNTTQAGYQQPPAPVYYQQPAQNYYPPNAHMAPGAQMSYSQAHHKRKRKKLIPLAAITAVLLLASAAVGFVFYHNRTTPEKVFAQYTQAVHSVSQVKQSTTIRNVGDTVMLFDVNDPKNPTVSLTSNLDLTSYVDLKLSTEGYGNFSDSYIKYTNYSAANSSNSALLNKWTQLRKDGVLPEDIDVITLSMAEAYANVFGDIVFGNFNDSDKQRMAAALRDSQSFDPKTVKKESLDGAPVYVYEITTVRAKIESYNKLAAEIMGANSEEVMSNIELSIDDARYKLYVRTDTALPVKVVSIDSDTESEYTTLYSDYNNIAMPAEPTPSIDLNTLNQLFMTESPATPAPESNIPASTAT